ncbi:MULTISPECIES: helix-turn-helix domain-containing protein [Streptomyces]|uniref:Helix-turn-helix transcriptional regulator n=1 Tax=Streptomyces koelreuteriae TaxID=2838015 RepID=A0ABX8FZI0_9ACTN|nr:MULTISPECIES: helix-turn-helix domain-containing protein [Streptomyces]QWB26340.1 helix-turn-helix transcriptional regulator [Streptomyces koelreuteriae]UUA09420.1 helix-turn-helix domain-containing protein [Streptomyces koelreuteriae]UUA17024.1 helix-turn-helix domain-containing protein [Streptomyces sp. CRCS-T-1]
MSDNELGTFLRTWREAVSPAEVGLPTGQRRRTPGLRRAELATLAGVSVEYLTRLEQGRDRNPSAQVLGALADALHLSLNDRMLLRRLTKEADGGDPLVCAAAPSLGRTARPTVRSVLDRLEPTPALVVNWIGDILAHTAGYERLAGSLGLLDDERPNLLRYLFTDERARDAYRDWDRVADDLVARLRHGAPLRDPYVAELADELTVTAGADFADRFADLALAPRRTGSQHIEHPEAGSLRLLHETLVLPDEGQRLIVHLPADDATAAALDRLDGRRPGALRAVGEAG